MIIVLLLLFQSLCLYCQRLVLHVHDRWINRTNARLLAEVAETVGDRKALQHLQEQQTEQAKRQSKERRLESFLPLGAGVNLEACRFCANSPQGYCRHHFHLQELQVQKQQQRHQQWMPLGCSNSGERSVGQEYRQLRRIKRELKRSLNQRLNVQQQHQQSYQQYRQVLSNLQAEQQQQLEEQPEEDQQELSSSQTSLTSGFISLEEQSISSATTHCTDLDDEELPPIFRTHIVTSYL
ncbi:putative cyclin-dependent serine/threonine-protein kinase DDB_G0272797/DDB_G0274007 [Scaptodrosophila lebanonensis]|uniref:Cyclin-dependent serine/threonine-protein kinase DDB_G0272797/DDB_G0274007 n=1 Tax=Drosophila lebanonensis TaxID=7225 RepID=A0A6J2U884_DROLE|nr:putative cyclin-dependent serine/threonine-protein kinase DDB_G0272797/DDB_G0274007 [Scaptodrosophila lebanonensis]